MYVCVCRCMYVCVCWKWRELVTYALFDGDIERVDNIDDFTVYQSCYILVLLFIVIME